MRIHRIILALIFFTTFTSQAQWKWINPLNSEFPVVQNQGWTDETGNSYCRFPDRAKSTVRNDVWSLSRHSAGLAIHFYCNAPEIKVRYQVSGALNMPHMPTTGVSGIDLYSIDSDGQMKIYYGGHPGGDTIQYHFTHISKEKYHKEGKEFRIYLPLYNAVKWMEIGIPEDAHLEFIPASKEKPIVVYGTSIAQGACASRPAMAWTSIMQRSLDFPLINLGFSGNGKLEKEVLDLINEVNARIYILDCLPNLTDKSEEETRQLVIKAVQQIRKMHQEPILLVEHIGYNNMDTNENQKLEIEHVNNGCKAAFKKLQADGYQQLYYLTKEELGLNMDAWVDCVHPSDWGMITQATAVEKKVREILHLPKGKLSITQAVTQRREPNNYEWQKRHRDILALNQSNPPKSVILGNSITHFWGGEPQGPVVNGKTSWEKYMRPAGFHNLGYGWDRIENLIWRIYHDELDGYNAEQVVVMIGTNNIGIHSDDEIMEGFRFLFPLLKERQPKAKIKIIGILPRRGMEAHVNDLNVRIQALAEQSSFIYKNPGKNLLQKDGKIDESLFTDGLHPNDKGYQRIVNEIVE